MDSDEPGYNRTEICEVRRNSKNSWSRLKSKRCHIQSGSMFKCFLWSVKFFRCENPSQRQLGINMMCGLLKKREQAVSLEAYSVISTPNPHSCAPTLISEGVTAESKMMNSDEVMKSDYGSLYLAFSAVFNHTVVTIAQCISESSGTPPTERSLVMSQWIKKLSEYGEAARLRYSQMRCHDTHPHTKLSHAIPTQSNFMLLSSAGLPSMFTNTKAYAVELIVSKLPSYAL